jgi:lambda repressor-like predicted transcriptional regulator
MEARLICSSSKSGESLSQISELTGLSIDEIMEILGQATGLTSRSVGIIFHMKQRGLSLEEISQRSGVELQVLEQFLPQEAPPVIKESVVGFEPQIKELFCQGFRPPEIGRRLGVDERAVLAYALGSPDGSLTSRASEPVHAYHRTPPPEEAKQPQRSQPSQAKPQHIPTFLFSFNVDSNQLHRVNLLTGEQSQHASLPVQDSLLLE